MDQVNIVFFTWSIKFLGLWLSGTCARQEVLLHGQLNSLTAVSSKTHLLSFVQLGAFSSKDPSEITTDFNEMEYFLGVLCSRLQEDLRT